MQRGVRHLVKRLFLVVVFLDQQHDLREQFHVVIGLVAVRQYLAGFKHLIALQGIRQIRLILRQSRANHHGQPGHDTPHRHKKAFGHK